MSSGRTARGLLVWVAVTTALLVGASRWAGRPGHRPDAGAGSPPPAAEAPLPAAAMGVDLSFYKSLGGGPAGREAPGAMATRPADDAPPTGAWIVQAMATRDARVARRVRDRLAARGLPATLIEGRDGRGTIWRVRAGRYGDRAGAEAVSRRIRKDLGLESWVLREHE